MQFANPIADGIYLVREALRSPNYVPGGPGWTINEDGTFELSGGTINGELLVGTNPGRIRIYGGPNNAGGLGLIQIGTRFIEYDSDGFLSLDSLRVTPSNGGGIGGFPRAQIFGGNLEIIAISAVGGVLDADSEISSGRRLGGFYTILNANQLRAENGGAVSELYLNYSGGTTICGLGGTTTVGGTLNVGGSVNGGGCSLSGGIVSSGGGGLLGTNVVLPGGRVDATNPPTGASPGVGVAYWTNPSGSTFRLTRNTSSRRYKENIRDLGEYASDQILSLVPRWFQRNDYRDHTLEDEPLIPVTEATPWSAGFIAEEADDLGLQSWVTRLNDGTVDGFNYGEFAAVAHQVVLRAQARKITELEERIDRLERLINDNAR